jgi:flagella basal body P-ring formation protein FlgA
MTHRRIGQIAKINSLILLPACVLSGLLHASSPTEQVHTFLANIEADYTARGFRVEMETGNFTPLLTERSCSQKVSLQLISDPMTQQHNTIEARCIDAQPWRLFINVELRLFDEIVLAERNVPRNTPLDKEDLRMVEMPINKGHYPNYREFEPILGMVAKQTIRQGSIITPKHLTNPEIVRRGDKVVIVADNDRIMIRMNGIALEDGKKGEQISVRNEHSERVIKAYVMELGKVNVTL